MKHEAPDPFPQGSWNVSSYPFFCGGWGYTYAYINDVYVEMCNLNWFVWQFHFLFLPASCSLHKNEANHSTCSSFSPQHLVNKWVIAQVLGPQDWMRQTGSLPPILFSFIQSSWWGIVLKALRGDALKPQFLSFLTKWPTPQRSLPCWLTHQPWADKGASAWLPQLPPRSTGSAPLQTLCVDFPGWDLPSFILQAQHVL